MSGLTDALLGPSSRLLRRWFPAYFATQGPASAAPGFGATPTQSGAFPEGNDRGAGAAEVHEWIETPTSDHLEQFESAIGREATSEEKKMLASRPTSELAADVETYLVGMQPTYSMQGHRLGGHDGAVTALTSHRALVARITDLEAQVEYTDRALTNMTEWHNEAMARLRAAEAQVAALDARLTAAQDECDILRIERNNAAAQVAALTQERNRLDHLHKLDHSLADQWSARAEAAEAALATTRQALTEIANEARPPKSNQFVGSVGKCGEVARRALAATEESE